MARLAIALILADTGYDIDGVARQLPGHEVVHLPESVQWDAPTLAARLRGFDVAVTGRRSPRLPDLLIGDRGRLRLLAHCHGTVKHLVSKALIEDGLLVSNWGDAVSNVAEGALALLFACLKQLRALDDHVRGDWKDDRRLPQAYASTLDGRPVGLYGFGPIGRHMGRFLQAMGAKVAIYDPFVRDVPAGVRVCTSLRELFATCDAVSIHCGLNDATRGSVTAELLRLLPQGGILINTARGPIVDEPGLVAVLREGHLLAGLDVIAEERTWATCELAAIDPRRVILSGHVVSKSAPTAPTAAITRRVLPGYVVANLEALAAGQPLINLIPAEIYDLKT